MTARTKSESHWLNRLHEENIHGDITEDHRWRAAKRLLELELGRRISNEETGELLEKYSEDNVFMAKVEELSLTETARHHKAVGHSIEQQMVEAHQSGLYAYHPDKFGSVTDLLRNALAECAENSGQFWDFNSLLKYVIPYCIRKHINIPELVWAKDSRAKLRHIAKLAVAELRRLGKEAGEDGELGPEIDKRIGRMLVDAANPEVSPREFRARYPVLAPSGVPAIEAYEYLLGGAESVMVMPLKGAQIEMVKELLRGKLSDVKIGTGDEDILKQLVNRKGKGKIV